MSPPHEQDPALSTLDPLPGRVIGGNFRIDKLIGSGAMGNVYKAEQLSLGKAVAIKVLHPHLLGDEKLVGRFKREAKSASLLNHQNSIQIIDSGEEPDGTLFIAMELLNGRDLAQVIRDDFPLPLPRVVRIMSQVLSALEEAHEQGIIHRDLKPSNIMLIARREEKDFVKVCDYGIAKATISDDKGDRAAMLTIQGLVCGTPEYMAPEQARAEPLDGRADLYAVAVILYQMVTGDIPFRADSPMAIVSRHLVEPPMPPSKRRPDLRLPKIIDDVVLRGLEKERDMRYATAAAFREVLEGVLGATSGPPTPLPPSVRASMPTARDISGHDLVGAGAGGSAGATATVPARGSADRFGTTADLSARSATKPLVVVGIAVLLFASGLGAFYTYRARQEMRRAAVIAEAAANAALATPTPAAPAQAVAVAVPVAPVPAKAIAAAQPSEPTAAPEPTPAVPREHGAGKHRRPTAAGFGSLSMAVDSKATLLAAPPSPGNPGAPPVAAALPPPADPAPRGPREVLAEANKLLSQGEVKDACARGEEAKRMGPTSPAAYRFLGQCYMRAGRTKDANDNYRQYLELAPSAPDAPFIKSIVR